MKSLKTIKIILAMLAMSIEVKAYIHQVEPLLGSGFDQNGISIQVFSGGCTTKNSFAIYKSIVDGRHRITFVRTNADPCRAFYRYGTKISFTYEELGIQQDDEFIVVNPRGAGIRH